MGISQRKRLCALFVSFTVVIMGGCSLIGNMSLDYYTVIGTLGRTIPAAIILGALGWIMGMILDKPKKKGVSSYNKLMMQELMKKDNIIVPENISEKVPNIISDNLEKEN